MTRQALDHLRQAGPARLPGPDQGDQALGGLLGRLASLEDPEAVAGALGDYLGCPVTFVVAPQDPPDDPGPPVQRCGSDVWVTVPLVFDQSRIGWLRATAAEPSELVLQLLVLAARVTSCLLWEQSRTQRAWQTLLEGGSPAPAELREAASALGWPDGAALAVLAAHLSGGNGAAPPGGDGIEARWHRRSLLLERPWPWRALGFRRGRGAAVIAPVETPVAAAGEHAEGPRTLPRLVAAVRAALTRDGGECAVGIGGVTRDLARLPELWRSANRALEWGLALQGPAAVAKPESFGILGLLVDHVPLPVLQEACRSVLGPLLEHDAHKGTAFRHTLQVFLACDGHFGEAARLLYVHENTLRHRIRRIQQTLSLDLDDAMVRAAVFTYLKLSALGLGGPEDRPAHQAHPMARPR